MCEACFCPLTIYAYFAESTVLPHFFQGSSPRQQPCAHHCAALIQYVGLINERDSCSAHHVTKIRHPCHLCAFLSSLCNVILREGEGGQKLREPIPPIHNRNHIRRSTKRTTVMSSYEILIPVEYDWVVASNASWETPFLAVLKGHGGICRAHQRH